MGTPDHFYAGNEAKIEGKCHLFPAKTAFPGYFGGG